MSLLRWAGSKRLVMDSLMEQFETYWNSNNNGTFWEPFGGSLSVTLAVVKKFQPSSVVVGDINAALVNFYNTVKSCPRDLCVTISALQDDYYANRYSYNHGVHGDWLSRAALFFYLNRTCFNGLYRVNQEGHYNVPWGKRAMTFDPDDIAHVSEQLRHVDIRHASFDDYFQTCLEHMKKGDLLYADPPYHSTFSAYDRQLFDDDAHKRLRTYCDLARAKGVFVVVSNTDTPFVREVWNGYDVIPFENIRTFRPDGKERGRMVELLIKTHQENL